MRNEGGKFSEKLKDLINLMGETMKREVNIFLIIFRFIQFIIIRQDFIVQKIFFLKFRHLYEKIQKFSRQVLFLLLNFFFFRCQMTAAAVNSRVSGEVLLLW